MTRGDGVPALEGALARLAERSGLTLVFDAVVGHGRAADTAAGARAAARALDTAGSTRPHVTGHHPDGRPCWPADATGSIAHAAGIAVAAVEARATRSVGVDLEVSRALPAADAAAVLAADEQAQVAAAPDPDAEATCMWAAKEAAFKAWCEATSGGLGTVDPIDLHVALGAAHDGARPVRVTGAGALAPRVAAVGPLTGWCIDTGDHALVLVTSARAARGAHHGVDGIASAAITSPNAANATT